MLILQNNDTIEICQGDYGNLGFTVSEYQMTTGDKAILVVKDLDRVIIKTDITEWREGVGYFSFNKEHTVSIPMGVYTYQIAIHFRSGQVNVGNENKFIVKRGVVSEL